MKRVYALYRVSTAKQVDHVTCGNTTKDDIPMQRIACHNFAERQQDWEIIRDHFFVLLSRNPSGQLLLALPNLEVGTIRFLEIVYQHLSLIHI